MIALLARFAVNPPLAESRLEPIDVDGLEARVPGGLVIAESEDAVTVVELTQGAVDEAAGEYPGYLDRFPSLYADAWSRLSN